MTRYKRAMPHVVRATLSFCYGHRIRGHQGKCAHLHGHSARAELECEGPLDALGMVVDFAVIRQRVGKWIDENWDHRTLLAADDPLLETLRAAGEPVVALDGPPTAEMLARLLYDVAAGAGLPVRAVHVWESETNVAGYVGGDR